MNELNSTSKLVKALLIHDERARNSDNYLFYLVAKKILKGQGISVDDVKFKDLFLNLKDYNVPPFETVGRARRKIQQTHPELSACEVVAEERAIKEDVFKEYAIGN